MSRSDRPTTSLRPLSIVQSSLSRADGSANFSFGPVSVLASVTGPIEVRIREELVDRATLEINVVPLRGLPGPSAKSTQLLLTTLLTPLISLHTYPRSLLQLTLQTLSSPTTTFFVPLSTSVPSPSSSSQTSNNNAPKPPTGASERSALINAAMLALIDAGVACKGMLVAVAVAFSTEGDLLLDPNAKEEEEAKSVHLFAFSFGGGVGEKEGSCVGVESGGRFDEDELFEAQSVAQTATQSILAFIRKSIESKYGVSGAPEPAQVKRAPEAGAKKEVEIEMVDTDEEDEEDEEMDDA